MVPQLLSMGQHAAVPHQILTMSRILIHLSQRSWHFVLVWHSILVKLSVRVLHVMTLLVLLHICLCFCEEERRVSCWLHLSTWWGSLIQIKDLSYFSAWQRGDCSYSAFILNVFYGITLLALSCCGWNSTHPPMAISSMQQCFLSLSCWLYSLHFFPQMAPRMIFKNIWLYFSTLLLLLIDSVGIMLYLACNSDKIGNDLMI